MSPWADPWVWLAIVGALIAGWVAGFLQAALLRGNDRPEIVGAIRRRCEMCDAAYAEPAEAPGDHLDLCAKCRAALNRIAGRSA